MLSQALGRLFAVAEAYPDLKANQNFLDLQAQLQDTEDKIAVSRQVYNDTVLTFNNAIQVFPAVLSPARSASPGASSSRSRMRPSARRRRSASSRPPEPDRR